MARRAKGVGNAVLAAVAYQNHMNVRKGGAAVCTGLVAASDSGRLLDLARLPMRALNRPWNDVLQAAERRPALARQLLNAPAVLAFDCVPAPGAASRIRLPIHAR